MSEPSIPAEIDGSCPAQRPCLRSSFQGGPNASLQCLPASGPKQPAPPPQGNPGRAGGAVPETRGGAGSGPPPPPPPPRPRRAVELVHEQQTGVLDPGQVQRDRIRLLETERPVVEGKEPAAQVLA